MSTLDSGATYRGCQTRTITGRLCQKWTAQSPHTHGTDLDGDGGLGDHNFCRNPNGLAFFQTQTFLHLIIWCITTDPGTVLEACVPLGRSTR
ncbi:unnamed protein product, partial [Amoebophrya sp. A120]|eukprot:GSA120T00017576001.1